LRACERCPCSANPPACRFFVDTLVKAAEYAGRRDEHQGQVVLCPWSFVLGCCDVWGIATFRDKRPETKDQGRRTRDKGRRTKTMRFHDLPWPLLRQVPRDATVVVAPIAACEQHSRHLPTFTDTLLVTAVAEGVEQRLPEQVLLLPTQWFGAS